MNQKLVTSFELSKELKEAGIEQKSEFYWIVNNYPEPQKYPQLRQGKTSEAGFTHYSAFLTGELGEMLPSDIVSGRTPDSISKGWDNWECLDFIEFGAAAYHHDDKKIKKPKFIADTEAESRGKMVLYLKKNKLI